MNTCHIWLWHTILIKVIANSPETSFNGRISFLNLSAQIADSHTQMSLQNLTNVHTRRHAQWVQYNIHWSTVWQERHILFTHNAGNYTLVTMTTGHLITNRNLTLLGNVDTNHLIYTRVQLIIILTAVNLNIYNLTSLTMRNLQRSITNLTSLLTKDSPQEALLSRQLSLTLWCNLAYQNITSTHIGTLANNTIFIQILQAFVGNIWNITGNFLWSKLGIASLTIIFLNMNGGINITLNQVFTKKNSILVVVTFPRHVGYDNVIAQSQLAVVSRRTVSDWLICFYLVTLKYDRQLVNAGTLVGTKELLQLVFITLAISSTNYNIISSYSFNHTGMLSQNHNTGVTGSLVLHTSTNQRSLSTEQWYSLTLHVCTHQRTVSIIVFQEWNHSCCNGYNLLW